MRITREHLYHGAALNQIADDSRFTAINAFRIKNKISRSAFKVNDNIGVYLKYASSPNGTFNEYVFTFNSEHLEDLRTLRRRCEKTFIALVCVYGGHICCLPYDMFRELLQERRRSAGKEEDQYTILVTLKKGGAFRVYVNAYGVRKTSLDQKIIHRTAFPKIIFE